MISTPDLLHQHAARQPQVPAIIAPDEEITWHDLHVMVDRAAGHLKRVGVESGDRVAILTSVSVDCLVAIVAVLRSGAIACCLTDSGPDRGLAQQLKQLDNPMLIGHPRAAVPSEKTVLTYTTLREPQAYADEDVPPLDWPLDRHATVVYTSGSTDQPKAAVHTWGNHYYSALGSADNIPFGRGDRWLLSLPLYHVGGLAILFRALVGGGTIVIPHDPKEIVTAVRRHAATHLSLVPTQLYRLLQDPASLARVQPKLRAVLLGGGPIPDDLLREACATGLPLHTSYGMTEMSSQVATTPPGALPEKIGTSGRVLPYRELKIGADDNILVRGDTLFAGYLTDGELALPLDDDGWFTTGDTGHLSNDDFLTVTGRRDNMFISGGENIQAEEVEAAIRSLPGVIDAIVVPVPDEEFGMVPAAYIQLDAKAGVTPFSVDDLKGELEKKLPSFKVPRLVRCLDGTPDGRSLKADRQSFVERARRDFRDRY